MIGDEIAPGNAQLRLLNPLVDQQLVSVCGCFVLPLHAVASRLACGVSSFGFSGTIAHALLAFGSRVADPSGGGVPASGWESDAQRSTFARGLLSPVFRRCTFPWCKMVSSVCVGVRRATSTAAQHEEVRHVDADMPLMEAGITSQRAVRLAAQLRDHTGAPLSATLIFEHPTVRAIATHLDSGVSALSNVDEVVATVNGFVRDSNSSANPSLSTSPYHVADIPISSTLHVPVSPQQELMLRWSLHLWAKYNTHILPPDKARGVSDGFCMELPIELPKQSTATDAQRALHLLLQRHMILRTKYAYDIVADIFSQVVLAPGDFIVPFTVCSTCVEWEALRLDNIKIPFELFLAPPIRCLFVSEAEMNPMLLLSIHHVAADAASLPIISAEVCMLCAQPGIHLPPPRMQYHEFAIEQRKLDLKMKDAGASDPHIAWWQAKLSDVPALSTLPNDNPRPDVQSAPGYLVIVHIEAAVASRLFNVCASVKATLVSGLIACFVAAITYRSQQSDFVVALPFVMRPSDDAVGYFSNDVLLYLKGLGELSLRDAIQLVHNESLQAIAHGSVPYDRIVQSASNAEHSCDKRTLYQTMVQLLDASLLPPLVMTYLESIDCVVTPVPEELHPIQMAEMDIKLDFFGPRQGTGDCFGFLQADSALFKPDTIATFCADLLQLISDASLSPDTPLSLC
jgi:hypothetical protein